MSLSISIMALLSLLCDSSSANDSCRCGMRRCQKRPVHVAKEAYYISEKETCLSGERTLIFLEKESTDIWKRDLPTWQKRSAYLAKETCLHGKRDLPTWQKRPAYLPKNTCLHGKRDLPIWQRGILTLQTLAKETYSCGKRDLFMWQKRPIIWQKRSIIWQKRPIHMAKETYSYDKRDLFIWQKRPIHLSYVGLFCHMNRPLLPYE